MTNTLFPTDIKLHQKSKLLEIPNKLDRTLWTANKFKDVGIC